MTCVVIETDESGKVSVGALPEDQKPDYGGILQPAQSVDEALAKAKQLLGGPQAQQDQAEGEFAQGFSQGSGPPAGRAQRAPGAPRY